jgi:hypothetical protein
MRRQQGWHTGDVAASVTCQKSALAALLNDLIGPKIREYSSLIK